MILALILIGWGLASIPLALIAGRFIRAGNAIQDAADRGCELWPDGEPTREGHDAN